jgi:RimJ/RimL family protein N-acetyltransferase
MDLFDPPELASDRLALTPFGTGDAAAARLVLADDPFVTRFVGWRPLLSLERAQRFVEREACAWRDREDCRGWLARARDTGEVIGSLIARRRDRSADFSYVVVRRHWNHGYATEMSVAFLERARRDRSLDEVWAVCDAENLASRRVLEKAGMQLDRMLPAHQRHNVSPEPRDCLRFTLLVGEPD